MPTPPTEDRRELDRFAFFLNLRARTRQLKEGMPTAPTWRVKVDLAELSQLKRTMRDMIAEFEKV